MLGRALLFLALLAGCAEGNADLRPAGQTASDADSSASRASDGGGLATIAGEGGASKPPPGDHSLTSGNLPSDVAGLFARARTNGGQAPTLVYPTPETMFPPNIARVLFQWIAPTADVFRLHFDSGQGTLDVFTDGAHETCAGAGLGAHCWESSSDTLMPYLAAAAGGTMQLQIAALDSRQPDSMGVSPSYAIHVAAAPVGGAIYYWSTTAQGVRRGTLDGRDAADYLTPDAARGQCVACHTLSRSGKRLSIALPGDLLGLVDVVETSPPPVTFGPSTQGFAGQNIAASWATFSPDESKIVVAGQGVLSVRDAHTAQPIGLPLVLPAGTTGSMPDWAPDGQHLVFAASTDATVDRLARHLRGSSIAWLSASGAGFSGFEVIAQSRGMVSTTCVGAESYANPMFSPDGAWLAFSRGDCESEADSSSEIILARALPNAVKDHLTRANTQVGDRALSSLQNGMPTWAPASDANIGWVAFTSARDYGLVLAEGSKIGVRMHQLWIAAIDFRKVGDCDPSYPAFRLPAQDLTENNHRPFWTTDALPPDWKPATVR